MRALGRHVDNAAASPGDLDRALAGQGLRVRRRVIAADSAVPPWDMAGLLLRLDDHDWLALRPGLHGPETLDGRPAPEHHAGECLVLEESVESLRTVLPFLVRHRGRLADILLASLAVNLLALLFPLFSSFVYDKVLGNGVTETLWALAIGLVLAIGLDNALRALRALLIERFAVSSEADIDDSVFQSLLAGNLARLPSVGLVLDKYKQILSGRDFLSSAYLLSALDVPFLALFLVVMAVVAGPLVLVPLVIGGLVIGGHLLFAIPVREYERLSRQQGERRFALLADTLTAREAILGGRARDEMTRRWRQASVRAGEASGRARYWHAVAQALSYSGANLAYVTVIVAGAHMVEARALSSGGLLAATMLGGRAMAALTSVVLLLTRYREFRQSLRELDALLPPAPVRAEAPARGVPAPSLRLVGVTCRLRDGAPPALDGLSLAAEAGEIIGLAGHPGAGKTTLLRVAAGLLAPDLGVATLNGVPIGEWSGRDVSAAIGYKPQEASLFEGSVEDNVLLGRADCPPAQVAAALTMSGLAAAVDRGELTLSTAVGPRGANLSGGQRQMVALARALLGAPPLLLLDEPSTGLDAPLEKALAEHLKALSQGRLIVVSSHSRTLLSACTRIVVIDGGRVITDGSREKVMGGGA